MPRLQSFVDSELEKQTRQNPHSQHHHIGLALNLTGSLSGLIDASNRHRLAVGPVLCLVVSARSALARTKRWAYVNITNSPVSEQLHLPVRVLSVRLSWGHCRLATKHGQTWNGPDIRPTNSSVQPAMCVGRGAETVE